MAPDFYNDETRVQLNPLTILRFEDQEFVTLQHPSNSKTLKIKADIILVLLDALTWKTVAELCKMWPEQLHDEVKKHLGMLYDTQVLVTTESELAEAKPAALLPETGDNIIINIENHFWMLKDVVRTETYRRAIERNIKAGDIVLDLGAGTGILSFFAAKAKAEKVYALEKRQDLALVIRKLSEENNLTEIVEVLQQSSHLLEASQLDPRPNIMISEILGNAILEENILEFTMDARDRLLAPGAKLIPSKLKIDVFAFDSGNLADKRLEVEAIEQQYQLHFETLKTVLINKPYMRMQTVNPLAIKIMSDPVEVKQFDFYQMTDAHFESKITLIARQEGSIDSFCAYFTAWLDEETTLSNSPWSASTHWTQLVFQFAQKRWVKAGEEIRIVFQYNGSSQLWFEADLN
jgi:predicted RNA methylase